MARQRMLFLARQVPWPLYGGARIRNYHFLRVLSSAFNVDLVTVGYPDYHVTRHCSAVHLAARPTRWNQFEQLVCGLQAIRHDNALWSESQISESLKMLARHRWVDGNYDVVHVSELGMARALPDIFRSQMVFDAHNCETRLLTKRALLEPWPLSALLLYDARRVAHFEASVVKRADLTLATSDTDRTELLSLCGNDEPCLKVIGNPIDVDSYKQVHTHEPDPTTVAITGSMDWRPNRQGLEWFIKRVLPEMRLRSRGSTVRILVAGRMSRRLANRLNAIPEVEAIPFPHNMTRVLQRAAVVAIPVLASSGTRLRLLEAFAARRAVITTSAGALGMEGTPGQQWLEADDPFEFAQKLHELMLNSTLRNAITEHAWLIARQHDWRKIGNSLLMAYGKILGTARREILAYSQSLKTNELGSLNGSVE